MNNLQGPPGDRLRPQPRVGRPEVLRRPRPGRQPVPAATADRLRGQGRRRVPVQPEQGEAAPAGGGPDAAGADRLLVPDERLPAVHAGPAAERRGVRREPRAVRLQGDVQVRAVAPGLPGPGAEREGRRSTCSGGRATSATRPTSSTCTSEQFNPQFGFNNPKLFSDAADGRQRDQPRQAQKRLQGRPRSTS